MLRRRPPLSAALLAPLAVLALALAACGSSDDPGTTAASTSAASTTAAQTTVTAPEKGRFSVKEIVKLTGLKPSDDGKSWTSVTGCHVTAILTTHAEVLAVRTNPDALVVTNGDDDVGVQFDPVAGCREALLANLSQVK